MTDSSTNKVRYAVGGMTCGGCARSLHSALGKAGIEVALEDISVPEGSVTIAERDAAALPAIVAKAGFTLGDRLG
jgi:copper chaperone CopZ